MQTASIAFAVAGLGRYISAGGSIDKAKMEAGGLFPEDSGFMVHGINGQMLIPLVAIALLIVSFFAKVPHGVRKAAVLLGLIVVQVILGLTLSGIPSLGILHGLLALGIFAMAGEAGMSARSVHEVNTPEPAASAG